MTKEEILSRLINQKTPSVAELMDKNRSLSTQNRIAYAGLIGLTALTLVMGGYAHKKSNSLDKATQENKALREDVRFYQKSTMHLSKRVMDLSDFANDAEKLAHSMKFYPDDPDSLTDLPDNALESAAKESEKMNIINREKHEQTLKLLGVDTNLLYLVQRGPKLPE